MISCIINWKEGKCKHWNLKRKAPVSHKLRTLQVEIFSLRSDVLNNPLATVIAVLLIVLNSSFLFFFFLTLSLTKMWLRNWWKQSLCSNISFWGLGKLENAIGNVYHVLTLKIVFGFYLKNDIKLFPLVFHPLFYSLCSLQPNWFRVLWVGKKYLHWKFVNLSLGFFNVLISCSLLELMATKL